MTLHHSLTRAYRDFLTLTLTLRRDYRGILTLRRLYQGILARYGIDTIRVRVILARYDIDTILLK